MKKTIITAAIIVSAVIAIAQTQVWIYQSDGTRYSHNYSTFDSLSRVAPGTLATSQSERTVPCEGETFSLAIFASQPWTATASDPNRIQLSKMSGNSNDTISVKVSANKTSEKVYDTVTLMLSDGTTNTLNLQTEAWKDALSISPFSKLFPPAGGAFKIGVSSNTTWTVSTSEPWVTLDKTSGTLNDSIEVTVGKGDKNAANATITVSTTNGKTATCTVSHEADKVLVDSASKMFSPLGGTYKIGVSSNTDWTISANESWITFDKTEGTLNDSILVIVGKADKDAASATITVSTTNGKTATCAVTHEADNVSVNPSSKTFAPIGGTCKIGITSNTDWTVSASEPWVTFDKTSGTLNDSIVVSVGKADKDAASATITVSTTIGKTATCIISHKADNVSVNPTSIIISRTGGTYKVGVTSNTDWTVSAKEPWVTFDKTKGTLNDSIKVTVAKSDNVEYTSDTITIITSSGKISQCYVRREGDKISLYPTTQIVAFEGGSVDVSVSTNTDWTASSSKSWATLSRNKGAGDATIVITVASNTKNKADTAVVTYTTSLGKSATLKIYRAGYTGKGEDVIDINGRSYPTVWIYGQNWMAENLKCDKYDTESEAYNASWLTNNTIPTSSSAVYTPYYTDASDKSKWNTDSKKYGANLSDAQVAKLGYLYNWAAAVGVEDGEKQTTEFTGNRQGICPNGWHIPTKAEWSTLANHIGGHDGNTDVGNKLKTTTGWYSGDEYYKPGLDTYGFSALPAGYAYGSSVYHVGWTTNFWTATPYESDSYAAYVRFLWYGNNASLDSTNERKYDGYSVRCLKDYN